MSNEVQIDPKYTDIAEMIVNMVEGIKRTGLQVVQLRDRYCKLRMPLEGNGNHVGIMYAGSLFSIGEVTGGIIPAVSLDMSDLVPIVKEINIKFVAPATTDVFLVAEISEAQADMIQKTAAENGKADFSMELELKDTAEKVVALVNGVWQVRNFNLQV